MSRTVGSQISVHCPHGRVDRTRTAFFVRIGLTQCWFFTSNKCLKFHFDFLYCESTISFINFEHMKFSCFILILVKLTWLKRTHGQNLLRVTWFALRVIAQVRTVQNLNLKFLKYKDRFIPNRMWKISNRSPKIPDRRLIRLEVKNIFLKSFYRKGDVQRFKW